MINLQDVSFSPQESLRMIKFEKKENRAAGGTSKYYGNMVMRCLFIVVRPLLYEIYCFKLEKCFK